DGIVDRERDLRAHAGAGFAADDLQRDLRRRRVARTDDGGEPHLPFAFGEPRERRVDRDARNDALVRRNVADLLREDVAAFLIEDRGGLALGDRLLELRARGVLRIDAPGDRAQSDLERVAAHRAVSRKRELVSYMQRVLVHVDEGLLEDVPRDAAGT